MNIFKFILPDKNKSIFRCEVFHDNNFMYSREVHLYDKNVSDEINVLILSNKMAKTLNLNEKELFVPVRIAILIGSSTWTSAEYE